MFCVTLRSIRGVATTERSPETLNGTPPPPDWKSWRTPCCRVRDSRLSSLPVQNLFVSLQLWHLIPGRHDFLRHKIKKNNNIFVKAIKFWLSQLNRMFLYCCFEITWGENSTECNAHRGSSPFVCPSSLPFWQCTFSVHDNISGNCTSWIIK